MRARPRVGTTDWGSRVRNPVHAGLGYEAVPVQDRVGVHSTEVDGEVVPECLEFGFPTGAGITGSALEALEEPVRSAVETAASVGRMPVVQQSGAWRSHIEEVSQVAEQQYDVIIVGSRPGGGITTYALATAGLKVALVEAGPRLKAGVDYHGHHWPYEYRDRQAPNFWRDNFLRGHFTSVGDRPGHGQIRALGGRSVCWAGHTPPLRSERFRELADLLRASRAVLQSRRALDGRLREPGRPIQHARRGIPQAGPDALWQGATSSRRGAPERTWREDGVRGPAQGDADRAAKQA